MKHFIAILMFGLAISFAVQANQFQSQDAMSGMSGFNFNAGAGSTAIRPEQVGPEITSNVQTIRIKTTRQTRSETYSTSKYSTGTRNYERYCTDNKRVTNTYIDDAHVGQIDGDRWTSCTAWSRY